MPTCGRVKKSLISAFSKTFYFIRLIFQNACKICFAVNQHFRVSKTQDSSDLYLQFSFKKSRNHNGKIGRATINFMDIKLSL